MSEYNVSIDFYGVGPKHIPAQISARLPIQGQHKGTAAHPVAPMAQKTHPAGPADTGTHRNTRHTRRHAAIT